jgi:phospholipase/carboxylesterase
MRTLSTTLTHRALPPERSTDSRPPLLIFLHGRGTDEEDLLGLAPMLDERLFLVSARAPFAYEYGGFTWYDITTTAVPDPPRFRESCDRLHQFLLDVRAGYPVDPARVFLFGFSMGCVMSLAMALTAPELIRGVSANSGYVPEGTHLALRWQELQSVEFFITHGTIDPVIPIALARRSQELFNASNAKFTYREYPAGHELTEEGLRETAQWLTGLIDGK